MSGTDLTDAIARGVAFLQSVQQPDGGFLNQFTYAEQPPVMEGNVFPAALIAHCLSFAPEGRAVRDRALDFLAAEVSREGLWQHFSSSEPAPQFLPPDVDDTACASAALRDGGRAVPDNEALLLANCSRHGLFYTWFTFRPRWSGWAHWRLVWPQRRHLKTLWPMFTRTVAKVHNIDAVVNANALFYFGDRPDMTPVKAYLLRILAEGQEESCDTWYPNRFQIWYFFARALAHDAGAARLLRERLEQAQAATPFEAALAQCARACVDLPPSAALRDLIVAAQLPSGAWGIERFYHGSDCWWGCEALTTAFAVEALARERSPDAIAA